MIDGELATAIDGFQTHFACEISDDQTQQIQNYCHALWQWNEKINLTRHTTFEKFVGRDLLDSFQLANLLADGEEILDVGSGSGVPGILLAILRSDLEVSLSESTTKKAKVLGDIVRQLGLPITVYSERAELVLEDFRFHSLTSRAVGPLWKHLKWFEPHWASFDRLLMIKGPAWVAERGEARHRGLMAGHELRRLATYTTPETGAESVILSATRDRQTT